MTSLTLTYGIPSILFQRQPYSIHINAKCSKKENAGLNTMTTIYYPPMKRTRDKNQGPPVCTGQTKNIGMSFRGFLPLPLHIQS